MNPVQAIIYPDLAIEGAGKLSSTCASMSAMLAKIGYAPAGRLTQRPPKNLLGQRSANITSQRGLGRARGGCPVPRHLPRALNHWRRPTAASPFAPPWRSSTTPRGATPRPSRSTSAYGLFQRRSKDDRRIFMRRSKVAIGRSMIPDQVIACISFLFLAHFY